ncbi:MAG: hypothetical protein V4757_10615 [Pseudomonadota bacterium]
MPTHTAAVRKRHVFYIAGFDPKGPGHYHALYRSEARKQCEVSGMDIETGARRNDGPSSSSWTVHAREAGHEVQTHYEFLRWDDIVRAHWLRAGPRLIMATLRTSCGALANGALWRMLVLSWPPCVALLAPPLLVAALIVFTLLVVLATVLTIASGAATPGRAALLVLAAAGTASAVIAARHAWHRWHMGWLMASHTFTAGQARSLSPGLDRRLDDWAGAIAAAVNSGDADEVLVVAHSSGTLLALTAMARVLPRLAGPAAGSTALSLMTLGQCLPMLSARPESGWFRSEIRQVALAPRVEWIDFSAPPDSCCFALVDPLDDAAGSASAGSGRNPKLLSPRFAAMFAPQDYAALRADRFRLHFQYIMSAPLPDAYDYFAITAGAWTLATRFAGKPSVTDFNNLKLFR